MPTSALPPSVSNAVAHVIRILHGKRDAKHILE